ncbi:unnamed protein product [Pedinophyceae sp. YPF-701]|nr:unnamed protein product [Pedinophyceae sp. YPF-701]
MEFVLPEVQDNPEGWGPCTVPEHLKDVPYAPYGKGDRLGRAADWTSSGSKYSRNYHNQSQVNAVFNFFNTDDNTFQLVDTGAHKARGPGGGRGGRGGRFQNQGRGAWGRGNRDGGRGGDAHGRGGHHHDGPRQAPKRQQRRPFFNDRNQPKVTYSPSVEISADWTLMETLQVPLLSKLRHEPPTTCDDLYSAGAVGKWDRANDRVTARLEMVLRKSEGVSPPPSTSNDPIMQQLAKDGEGDVFITDALLSALMCATRAVYPWDLVVTKRGDALFFDRRHGSHLDRATAHETAPDPVEEEAGNVNALPALNEEATRVCDDLRHHTTADGEPVPLPATCKTGADPFDGACGRRGFRYRRFELSDGTRLVVRCSVDGVQTKGNDLQTLALYALPEYSPKGPGDWRRRVETQRGAVLATEIKNNTAKVARWATQALLAGVDLIKFGYVTRRSMKDPSTHVLLATQPIKPSDLAQQIALRMEIGWGIASAFVKMFTGLKGGRHLIAKDPANPVLRVFEVPAGTFADDGIPA